MDFWLTYHDNYAIDHLILPKQLKITGFKTITDSKKATHSGTEDNVRKAKQKGCKPLNEVLETKKIGLWIQKNVKRIENSNEFIVGEDREKIYLGPVLHVVDRNTRAEIKGKEIQFFEESLFNKDNKPIRRKNNEIIVITGEAENDMLIVVSTNGTFAVKSGGGLFIEMPLILVKSTGDYFTIGKEVKNEKNHILRLKSGINFLMMVNIGGPVPILFLRKSEQKIDETQTKRESIDTFLSQKSQISHESVKTEGQVGEPLPQFELKVERLKTNDIADPKFIPDFILAWINGKGYQLETGGGEALLGIGYTSVVRRGTRIADKKLFAIKVIIGKSDEISRNNGRPPQQLIISKVVDHKNIVKCEDVFCVISEVPNKKDRMFSFLVMEIGRPTNLEREMLAKGRYTESEAKLLFRQVMSAVAYLHSKSVAHLRVRLQNCLVMANGTVKLCDFGRAENISHKTLDRQSNIYSWKLMPPEFYDNNIKDVLKIDVWMSGCLLTALFSGNLSPFGFITRDDYYKRTEQFMAFRERQKTVPIKDLAISVSAVSLLTSMLETDPNKRFDSKTVMASDWFK